MLEYEKKVLLTEAEYAVLADQCPALSVVLQTNYYYDTDDLYMNSKGIVRKITDTKQQSRITIRAI